MTLKCKAGDICIVISGPSVSAIVECVEFVGVARNPVGGAVYDDVWRINTLSWCTCARGTRWPPGSNLLTNDSCLQPLPPKADVAAIDAENTAPVVAEKDALVVAAVLAFCETFDAARIEYEAARARAEKRFNDKLAELDQPYGADYAAALEASGQHIQLRVGALEKRIDAENRARRRLDKSRARIDGALPLQGNV